MARPRNSERQKTFTIGISHAQKSAIESVTNARRISQRLLMEMAVERFLLNPSPILAPIVGAGRVDWGSSVTLALYAKAKTAAELRQVPITAILYSALIAELSANYTPIE